MLRKLTLAIAAVALLASPAFAAVQNVKVSGKIDSSYIYRDRFDLGSQVNNNRRNQSFGLTQTLLRVDADLSDNVQATVQLLNERAWGGSSIEVTDSNNDTFDIDGGRNVLDINLAYVTLREFLYSPLTVVVGRQILHYGNGFIIGDGGPNNSGSGNIGKFAGDMTLATAHDAVKVVLDYKPLTIDLFVSKEDANNLTGGSISSGSFQSVGDKKDDVDLFGVNANYQLGDDMNSVVEAYFFGKIDRSSNTSTSSPRAKTDKVYVPGLRASTNPISGLNVQGEVAWQTGVRTGSTVNERRDALGVQGIINYQVTQEDVEKYKPVVQGVYTFVSGDADPNATDVTGAGAKRSKFNGWDPMFEAQASGKIYNALFNLTNAHIAEVSAAITPIEDVTTKLSWTQLWSVESLDRQLSSTPSGLGSGSFLVQPDGSSVSGTAVTSNRHLGQEIDADIMYNYTEDVLFGLSLGMFLPGDAFAETASVSRKTASQAIAHVAVTF